MGLRSLHDQTTSVGVRLCVAVRPWARLRVGGSVPGRDVLAAGGPEGGLAGVTRRSSRSSGWARPPSGQRWLRASGWYSPGEEQRWLSADDLRLRSAGRGPGLGSRGPGCGRRVAGGARACRGARCSSRRGCRGSGLLAGGAVPVAEGAAADVLIEPLTFAGPHDGEAGPQTLKVRGARRCWPPTDARRWLLAARARIPRLP